MKTMLRNMYICVVFFINVINTFTSAKWPQKCDAFSNDIIVNVLEYLSGVLDSFGDKTVPAGDRRRYGRTGRSAGGPLWRCS